MTAWLNSTTHFQEFLPSQDGDPERANSLATMRFWNPRLLAAFLAAAALQLGAAAGFGAESHFTQLPAAPSSTSGVTNKASVSAQTQSTTNSVLDSTNQMDLLDQEHRLAIGDRLSLRIVEDEEDPKSLVVTDSGDLEVPYIGRFPASGKTCRELARALKGELEKEYYYQATVILAVDILAKTRGKVYIVGPVRAPGPVEIPGDEVFTLSKAILRAGGFTDYADKKNVRVTRNSGSGDQTFKVNVAEILDKGKTETDMKLESGDLIVIAERTIRF